MSDPVVRQVRRPILVAGGDQKWEVTCRIVDRGDLPFAELFVLSVVDPNDPKTDVFARVAEPLELRHAVSGAALYVKADYADMIVLSGDTFVKVASTDELTALARDRVVAVARGSSRYLASAVTLVYDNLTSADAAYRQLNDRLSTLVSDWRTASGTFITDPYTDYNLPTVSASVEAQRVAAWRTARATRVQQESARDAALASAEGCEQTCASDRALYDELLADVSFLQRAKDRVTTITETATITSGSGTATASAFTKTFVLDGSDAISYETLLTMKRGKLATVQARVQSCQTRCADLRQAAVEAQASVDAARRTENEALASVLTICPTFDASQN